MSKIMLVEDDNNLREIYEARLAAEGYEIISAPDGEAALALAIKERPDLIISDIMMPKVSGFDMLDILKSTTETKDIKVIMMTALNQAEDKTKAEKLGANVYLVKSQVTLEDVVRSVKELLGEEMPVSISGIPVHNPASSNEATQSNSTPLVASVPAVNTQSSTNTQSTTELLNTPPTPPTNPAPPDSSNTLPPTQDAPQPAVNKEQSEQAQVNKSEDPQPPITQPPANHPPQTPTNTTTTTPPESSSASQTSPTPTTPPVSQPNSDTNQINENKPSPLSNESANEIASASSTANEEEMLQKQIEQFISDETPKPTTVAPSDVVSAPTPVTDTQVANTKPEPSQTSKPESLQTPAPETPKVPTPTPANPVNNETTQTTPSQASNPTPTNSTMAQPPSSLGANTPEAGDPNADRPAGEQVLAKNSSDDISQSQTGIDASISGRKKVIQPINDITKSSSNLANIVVDETGIDTSQPQLNSVITPEGITLASNNGAPTMNDIIVPSTQSAQNQTQVSTEQPLPPPVA